MENAVDEYLFKLLCEFNAHGAKEGYMKYMICMYCEHHDPKARPCCSWKRNGKEPPFEVPFKGGGEQHALCPQSSANMPEEPIGGYRA